MVESTLPGFKQCSLLTLLAIRKKKPSKKQTKKPHKSNAKKKNLNRMQKLTKNIFKAP